MLIRFLHKSFLLVVRCNFVESHKEQFFTQWLEEVSNSDQLFPQPIAVQNRDRDCVPVAVRNHLKQYLAASYPLRKTLIR